MGDKRLSMVGTGQGDRRPSMEEVGQEAQETLHRGTQQRNKGPLEGAKQGEMGHSMGEVEKMTHHPSWRNKLMIMDQGVGRAWETTNPPWQDQARETENPPQGGHEVCTGDSP